MPSGCVMVKFRGRYWKSHYPDLGPDPILETLGVTLVTSIPSDPEGYRNWLQALRRRYTKWDALLQKLLCIREIQINRIEHENEWPAILDKAFHGRMEFDFPDHRAAKDPHKSTVFFTIDLDLEVFSIDKQAHYRLDQIPRDGQWIKALLTDNSNLRFVHPDLAPKASLASLVVDNQQLTDEHTEFWRSLQEKQVLPAIPEPSDTVARFRYNIFKIFEYSERTDLDATVLSWTPDDLPFREYAFCILCLAAGGENLTFIDQRRVLMPDTPMKLYSAVVDGKDPKSKREFLCTLASGFHRQGQPVGSAPHTSKYWFQGALICLVSRLDQPGVATKAMADAVRYGTDECGRTSFHAVIISILEFVLLKRFPDGSIQYTKILRLMTAKGTRCMNAEQRYDKLSLERFLKPHNEEVPQVLTEKEKQGKNVTLKKLRSHMKYAFLCLVNFFDAIAFSPSTSKSANGARLPPEVTRMILQNVDDQKTYNACRDVSRVFRTICNERPWILDGVIFTKPVLDCATFSPASQRLHEAEFHAVIPSAGREADVMIRIYDNYRADCAFRYATGSGFNRKSRVLGLPVG